MSTSEIEVLIYYGFLLAVIGWLIWCGRKRVAVTVVVCDGCTKCEIGCSGHELRKIADFYNG